MPAEALTKFAIWGDYYGNFGQPGGPTLPPPDPDINIDIDEDGNVTITPPDKGDVDRDEDGNITITLPPETEEGDVDITLPGDDWDINFDRDEDGNLIITITPPTRNLVVTNLPNTITRPVNQTPVSGTFRVGAIFDPWVPGTAPTGWIFLGWANTEVGLVAGQPVPTGILIPTNQLPDRMPGAGFNVFARWGDSDGRFGQPNPPIDEERPPGEPGQPGQPGIPGAPGPSGTLIADGRPVPKTGDTANVNLWMVMFMLGLLGLSSTGVVLTKGRKWRTVKPSMFIIDNEDGKEQFFIK
jgi:hypothetical protein